MQTIGLHGPARAGKDTIADYLVERHGFIKFAFSDALYREVADAYALPSENLLRGDDSKEVTSTRLSLDRCNDSGFVELARAKIVEQSYGLAFPKSIGLSPRWILQTWGTEYRRVQDPEYWIKKADQWMIAYTGSLMHTVTQEDNDEQYASLVAQYPAAPGNLRELCVPVGAKVPTDHPGVAVSGVRFQNEYDWLKGYNGFLWHVTRPQAQIALSTHTSEKPFPLRTGDKLIQNNSTIARLHTGIALALQGNDIVNTAEE